MANMFDYLKWRGDLSFNKDKFNIVDALILASITYLDYDSFIPKFPTNDEVLLFDAFKEFYKDKFIDDIISGYFLKNDPAKLGYELMNSKRFKNLKMTNNVNFISKESIAQFSATTFVSSQAIYVAFKGTDDTLVGWQEDFNMLVDYPIPAQIKALEYLDEMALKYDLPIYVLGHSKGGNIAIYSSCKSKFKDRIVAIYSFDGPGFYKENLSSDELYVIKDKIYHVIPKDSIIGMLFNSENENKIVVDSISKGLSQHSPFNWMILGNDFIRLNKPSKRSINTHKELSELFYSIDKYTRAEIIIGLHDLISKINKETLSDVRNDLFKSVLSIRKMNPLSRKVFFKLFNILMINGAFKK